MDIFKITSFNYLSTIIFLLNLNYCGRFAFFANLRFIFHEIQYFHAWLVLVGFSRLLCNPRRYNVVRIGMYKATGTHLRQW